MQGKCYTVECPTTQRFYNGRCVPLLSECKGLSFDYRLKITFLAIHLSKNFSIDADIMNFALGVIANSSVQGKVCGQHMSGVARNGDYYEAIIHIAVNTTIFSSPQQAYYSLIASIKSNNRAWESGYEIFKVEQADTPLQVGVAVYSDYHSFKDILYTETCPVTIAITELQFCPHISFEDYEFLSTSGLRIDDVTLQQNEYQVLQDGHFRLFKVRVCVSKFYYLKTGKKWKSTLFPGVSNSFEEDIPDMNGAVPILYSSAMTCLFVVFSVIHFMIG